jgi:hypothetical protein
MMEKQKCRYGFGDAFKLMGALIAMKGASSACIASNFKIPKLVPLFLYSARFVDKQLRDLLYY